jgi:hypothetical protein
MRQRAAGASPPDRIAAERQRECGLRGPKPAPRLAPAKGRAAVWPTAVAARAGGGGGEAPLDPAALARSPFVDLDSPLTLAEVARVRRGGVARVEGGLGGWGRV